MALPVLTTNTWRGPETWIGQGGVRVTPESRVLQLKWASGGFVWHWPSAVLVEYPDERVQRVRILDVTRLVQVAILGGAVAAWLVQPKGERR